MPTESTLTDRLFARDPRAVARAISLIEDADPVAPALVARLQSTRGQAHVIGVTGPPGAGKSTLVDQLIAAYRRDGKRVGVLAVDPSSVFTGGAILGDRVRMQAHFEDADVFIRSMATRGHLGGLARATRDAILVLAAAGFDIVIIETVGVGQDEIDIVRTADVSIVTLVPGAGDEVQALKAGIMEIADIFVINKADREGADRTAAHVEAILSLEHPEAGAWRPPVLRAVATTGDGVPGIVAAIAAFRGSDAAKRSALARAASERRLARMTGGEQLDRSTETFATTAVPAKVDSSAEASGATGASGILPGSTKVDLSTEAAGMIASAAKVDHLGIAVADAAPYVELFATLFGLQTDSPEIVGLHRLRFVQTGDTTLELVEPLSPDSPIAKFLASRGAGLHHLCLRVQDIDTAIAELRDRGVRLIDEVPRQGAHGSRIAFIHPSSTLGLLIELKEPAH